jgi:predicted small lipoprotein YifL
MGQTAGKAAEIRLETKISLRFQSRIMLALVGQVLYIAARFGDFIVICHLRPAALRSAVVLLSVATLSLAGCGRKGPLDLPPSASGSNTVAAAPAQTDADTSKGSALFNSNVDSAPVAPKGQKRPFILDPLLDERPQ